MVIDKFFIDALTSQAKKSSRLRMHFDLRNTSEDFSQRILNALEPGTEVPIHRHQKTSETVTILSGSATQYFYDEFGNIDEIVTIKYGGDCVGVSIEKGRWHRIEPLESGTVILECKDGAYEPVGPEDILEI